MSEIKKTYDFSCYVIKYDQVSIHGKIYQKNSLENNDGILVPLCWDHDHYSANNVLGTAWIEHRDDGVYAYCALNNTDFKDNIIKLLRNKGTLALSPYINCVKYNGNLITNGAIREVSLVPERIDPDEAYYPVLNEKIKIRKEKSNENSSDIYW